jgi:hypothetical protein
MIQLELDKHTEERFNKLLSLYNSNYSELINSMIQYRIVELKKGINNIELDFVKFERKYNMKSHEFYKLYETGNFGEDSHKDDFMIWSSEYESYLRFQKELKQLQ